MPAIALGNFDGVHLAHRAVLEKAAAYDNSICLLFRRHPVEVLTGKAPGRLLTPAQTEQKILQCGIGQCVYLDFEQVRDMAPEQFFEEILIKQLGADVLCCGYNYTFGKQKTGDVTTLKALCAAHGVDLCVADEVDVEGEPVSSTAIRRYIRQGNIEKANAMLGYPFFYEGVIVEGKRLGKTLGFPTINQLFGAGMVKPKAGVYASTVTLRGNTYKGLTNIGDNPTIGTDGFRSETYIFDFEKEVYGESAKIRLHAFLREEKKFESVAALTAQVLGDIERAKDV